MAKRKKQRAHIIIDDNGDGKFRAQIFFEPSIQLGKTKSVDPAKLDNIAVQAAHRVWKNLKEQQKSHIILTDEV